MPQAREAALKALALDDNLAEAHALLGLILIIYDWNWAGGIKHYRRAIELNSNFANAHRWLGESLVENGRFDEGLAEIRRSVELDPFSLAHNTFLGRALNYARRYDEAIIQLQKTLELDPNFNRANYNLYEAYTNKGMYREAWLHTSKESRSTVIHPTRKRQKKLLSKTAGEIFCSTKRLVSKNSRKHSPKTSLVYTPDSAIRIKRLPGWKRLTKNEAKV